VLMRAGKLDDLDKEHLIQYLTEMTIRDRRELRSRLTVLFQHLLKIEFQPTRISRSWINTILEQQRELKTLLEAVPSILTYIPQLFNPAYQDAVRHVTREIGIPADRLPVEPPWTLEQALEYDPPIVRRPAQPRRKRSSPK
jgi:hypothetical protein